jgi:Tfp pilus assembly PilM family ATPase
MSRLLTLECDVNEVRLAVGSSGLTGVNVEHVMSAPILLPEGTEPYGSPQAIEALRELLGLAGIKSGNAIVCVSRNDIELRAITLPLVDSNELPDMVRFAAPRYFANVNDSWPLDFITMPSHLEGSIDCIVGAINPALIEKIESTVEAAGLTLSHMVLRPMAAAAGAIAKHPEWNQATLLFIDLLNDEADVVISEKGNAVFMRTFHAPSNSIDAESAKLLSGEVKRTIFSAISQRPGLKVDQIVVWTRESLAPFAQELGRSLELPVTMLDPFSMAERANISIAATTQTIGRFAPVLGALHFPQESRRLIDFANPRKKVEKKKPIAQYIAAAVAGVATLAGSWWWYSSSHTALDAEIALLNEAIASQNNIVKVASKNSADWKKLEAFQRGDIRWLDELERLSVNAQNSDDAYFGVTTFLLDPRSNVASISAKYYAREKDLVPEVQSAYRDAGHTVRGTGVSQSPDKMYPWGSDLLIAIAPPEVPDPRNVKRRPIEPETSEPAATVSESKPEPPADVSLETKNDEATVLPKPASDVPSDAKEASNPNAATNPNPELTPAVDPQSKDPGTPEPTPSVPETTPNPPESTPPVDAPILGGAS